MKKIILSALLLAATYSLFAQESPVVLKSSASYPAYSVPSNVRTTFQTTYPDVTVVTWEPVDNWWMASYAQNNRIRHVYYNTSGNDYIVALPVINSQVPETVVDKSIGLYGTTIYAITKMKAANNSDVYKIHLIENG